MSFLKSVTQTIDLGDGRSITLETGKLARQADGSVLVKMGNAVLLCTVVSSKNIREGIDFFPLMVDYQEKFASAGRIPGGFFKREARLTTAEILVCRLCDRALRPLFPDGYKHDTQVAISLISNDPEVRPDALAALGASAALTVSDIPFQGPISEVRVARIDGEYVVNPSVSALAGADLDIIVAATMDNIMMVEGESKEVSEEDLIEAIKVGHEAIKVQCEAQLALAKAFGTPEEKRDFIKAEVNEVLREKVGQLSSASILRVASAGLTKSDRKKQFREIRDNVIESLGELEEEDMDRAKKYFHEFEKEVIREMVLASRKRLDGRDLDEVRPLHIEIDVLPSPHGASLFTRGETQALCTATLGTKQDEQMLDKVSGMEFSKFMLHYNFPPFCTGEVKPTRGPSRREIGHGNLAERSLRQVLPEGEDNPYTIRIVSDVLESNGSSSMASVCGGSLALMDAGVKISGSVSGVAMGMIADKTDSSRYAILTDILGDEDHLGDMDFKVTGTEKGICACQMDIKVDGLSYDVMAEALAQAKEGRMHILKQMDEVIGSPREEMKPHAPRITRISISKEFIGPIIGPGGKHIQELQRETGTTISIEEIDERGVVIIAGTNQEGVQEAVAKVKAIAYQPEIGDEFEAVVKSIMPYGAFVEFLPGKQGLLHISEISWSRLETMDDVFEEGETVKVKLTGIDARSGKFKLSRKVLLPRP